jgi:hypothetical protein
MIRTSTLSKTRSIRVLRGSSNRLSLLLRELKSVTQLVISLHSFLFSVGKPLVLNGFGLVSQTNLNNFVPFNMSYAPYATNTGNVVLSQFNRVLMFLFPQRS